MRIAERLSLMAGELVNYRQVDINPLLLFSPEKGYYRYTGSLANPLCSEPVTWFILATPVELSPELIGCIAQATGGQCPPGAAAQRPSGLRLVAALRDARLVCGAPGSRRTRSLFFSGAGNYTHRLYQF